MNVLFFSQAAMDTANSVGNTISNWFSQSKDDFFCHFYTRKAVPNNDFISLYYNLSAGDILRGITKFKIHGLKFSDKDLGKLKSDFKEENNKEQKQISYLHNKKGGHKIIYTCMEILWMTKIWICKDFESFVDMANPDLLFAFATNEYILYPLITYLKKKRGIKVALFIADDVLDSILKENIVRRKIKYRYLSNCLKEADIIYGASSELCEKYNAEFHINSKPLYKGCSFEYPIKNKTGDVIRMVYAGNLLYGRAKTLGRLVDAIEKVNMNSPSMFLEIYTGTAINSEDEKILNREGSSKIMGSCPYEEIKRVLADSDIVLHVETFDSQLFNRVKYSFSTKIIDCIQSGAMVLAIGPEGQAGIEYLRKIDGASVIDDIDNLEHEIKSLIEDKDKLLTNAEKIRKFAEKNHSIDKTQQNLLLELHDVVES